MSIEEALMRIVAASKEHICDIAKRADVDATQLCRFLNDHEEALSKSEIERLRNALNEEDRQKWLLLVR